jgi:hypothetical protein
MQVFLESGGAPLISFLQNDAEAAIDFAPGRTVSVSFEPGGVVVLDKARAS